VTVRGVLCVETTTMAIKLALVAALLLRATACCCGASLQGAVYNETLAKNGALW
jgi:hypothetical protein